MIGSSHQAAKAGTVLRSSVWCGFVIGLASLIASLNVFPPSDLEYDVRSEILVAKSQVPTIRQAVDAETELGLGQGVTLESVTVQTDVTPANSDIFFRSSELASQLTIRSSWTLRCNDEDHESWVRKLASPDPSRISESHIAKTKRFASWEASVAEHYLQRETFLADRISSDQGRVFTLSSNTEKPAASLTSYDATGSGLPASPEQIRQALQEDLQTKKSREAEAIQQWESELAKAGGRYQVLGPPEVSLRISQVPTVVLASIFFIGIFSGASCGLIFYRIQSGGSYSPAIVAKQLAAKGLPVAGYLSVPDPAPTDVTYLSIGLQMIRTAVGVFTQNLTRFGEWFLGFWVLLLLCRLVTDEMWRELVVLQPLVALSRLFVGLP